MQETVSLAFPYQNLADTLQMKFSINTLELLKAKKDVRLIADVFFLLRLIVIVHADEDQHQTYKFKNCYSRCCYICHCRSAKDFFRFTFFIVADDAQ